MADAEERLARLEEQAFFQEERLNALDVALTDQQRQMDQMARDLADALAAVRLLRDKLEQGPGKRPAAPFYARTLVGAGRFFSPRRGWAEFGRKCAVVGQARAAGAPPQGPGMNKGPVAGVVLAGGLSTRLGQDKAALRLTPQAPDLLARTHALLCTLLPCCWVSCRAECPRPGYDCVWDAVSGQGPLGGVAAALTRARDAGFAAVLALSCDLPFMDAATLTALLDARQAAPPQTVLTCYAQAATGRLETLAAVYEIAALPFLSARSASGGALHRRIPAHCRHVLPYGPEAARPFFNLNSPQDLAAARAMLPAAAFRH